MTEVIGRRCTSVDFISGPLPDPPVFSFNTMKFTVPPYFSYEHAETQWLINMIRSNSWDRIWRVALSNPSYFSQTYVQFPDCPDSGSGVPMFHRRAVLYLTPLGLALYMKKNLLVKRILEFKTDDDKPLVNPNQQQYAANVFERNINSSDLHVIFPFCILFRREAFESVRAFLKAGWNPHEGFILPYRKVYQLFSFEYKDFLDYCVAQMTVKPNIRLPNLLTNMILSATGNFSLMEYEKVQLNYKVKNFEDWVSLPRRMLRFVYYFDKDLRVAGQIIRSVGIAEKFKFFNGPCLSAFDVNYTRRRDVPNSKKEMILFDQDCCISLMLGIFYRTISLRHIQTQEKLVSLIVDILVQTHWLCHFLTAEPQLLITIFENLIENVKPLKNYLIDIIKTHAIDKLKKNHYNPDDVPELEIKNTSKTEWERAINYFVIANKEKFVFMKG